MARGYITINNVEVPCPDRGLTNKVATLVSSSRNAKGVTVGQKIGRDQYKIDSLSWNYLTAEEWSTILKLFSDFYVTVTFPDMVNNDWITLKMYPGDRSAEPQWLDEDTGLPTHYTKCKVNIIDCGYVE